MRFQNSTSLSSARLLELFERHTAPWSHEALVVRVRYSRGADFSGACYYRDNRIFINLGRHVRYPYAFATHLCRARTTRYGWQREVFRIEVADAYQLALFIYLHELFHYLVKAAGRCTRQKEAMCDRFAARALVDAHGCPVYAAGRRPAERASWDFQDLERFVARAPRAGVAAAARRPIPVRIVGVSDSKRRGVTRACDGFPSA